MATKISDLHKKWSKDPEYRAAYEALEPQYKIASLLIEARNAAGLSQEEVAKLMGTKQSAISRIESGANISIEKLVAYSQAVGRELEFSFR